MAFKKLKKKSSLDQLQEEAKKMNQGNDYSDDRFWYPERDKAGNAVATIRFLPGLDDEDNVWVRYFSHGFQNPKTGKWLIENCPTSIDSQCPVCEMNGDEWDDNDEAAKSRVRKRKRQLHYVCNILVVDDPQTPDNNGKVFLYRFGKRIFDKLNDAMNPEFEDQTPMNPFHVEEGADFKLRIRKVDGQTNYDKSEFLEPSEVEGDLEEIYNAQYPLKEFVDESQYKSYDEIKKRLNDVMGNKSSGASSIEDEEEYTAEDEKPKTASSAKGKMSGEKSKPTKEAEELPWEEGEDSTETETENDEDENLAVADDDDEDEEIASFFKKFNTEDDD